MRNSLKYILAAASMLMGVAAYAAGDGDDNGLRVNKTRSEVDANGNYTLTLTSFAVGEQTPNMEVPVIHAALVLDVSGSMKQGISRLCKANELKTKYPSGVGEGVLGYGYSNTYYEIRYNTNRNTPRWEYKSGSSWSELTTAMLNRGAASIFDWTKGTRIDALKNACYTFIDTMNMKANEGKGVDHQLYIIPFSNTKPENISMGKYSVKTTAGKNDAITKIRNLTTDSYTHTEYGLERAKNELNKVTDPKAKKVVIVFTDGAPSSKSDASFEETIANLAIGQSKDIKALSETEVYSVNVYPDSDNDMHKFMNYVSSNYPNAESMSVEGTGGKGPSTSAHDYYKQTTSASELEEIFKKIADGFSGGSDFDPGAATVVVKDVLTPSFTIPEGGQVKVYVDDVKTAPAHPTNSKESDYSFTKSTTPASGLTPKIEGKTVSVEGFDFAANWVGYKYLNEEQTQKDIHGKQLRIEITVHKSEESEGGYEDTNDPSSGIYVGGQNYNPYPIPDVVFTNIVDLVITRSGMKAGETSIYEVKGGSIDILVPVTAVNDTDPAKTVVSVAINSTNDPNGDQIEYTVSEKTDWSWANSEQKTSTSKKLAKIDSTGRIHNDNHFSFGVESTRSDIAHDEDNAKVN